MAVPATLTGILISCMVENMTPYKLILNRPGIKVKMAINRLGAPVPTKITSKIDTANKAPPKRNQFNVEWKSLSAKMPPNGAATNMTT